MERQSASPYTLEIRNPIPAERDALSALWQKAFGDEPEYIERFFDAFVPSSFALTAWIGDALASMLFLLPSVLTIDEASYDGCYVYAVATAPAYRGQGIMTRLEEAACRVARQDGAKCMALVPASQELFHLYSKLGYHTRFFLGNSEIAASVETRSKLSVCTSNDFTALRREMLRRIGNHFDLYPMGGEYRYHELLSAGKEILRVDSPEDTGYIVGWKEGETYHIAESSLSYRGLSQAAGRLKECRHVRTVLLTGKYGALKPYGMLKLLDDTIEAKRARCSSPYMNLMLN